MKSLSPRAYPLRWIMATLFLGALVINWLKWREPTRPEPIRQTVVITIEADPFIQHPVRPQKGKLYWPEHGHKFWWPEHGHR